jgi:hypothetical protein
MILYLMYILILHIDNNQRHERDTRETRERHERDTRETRERHERDTTLRL